MQVDTVTTLDRSLLSSVRGTIDAAESALLCVAFVQERGVHLLEKELDRLHRRRGDFRLLVTTTFASTDTTALAKAANLGAQVRVLNPGTGSYHPKVYLGLEKDAAQAVVGSANLTGGLATNLEAGVWMRGRRRDSQLARLVDFAEHLWEHPRARPWQPGVVAESARETFDAGLQPAIMAAVQADPVFMTLGHRPRPNLVLEVTYHEVLVETDRSKRQSGPQPIPAWMFNLAWRYLQTHGQLSNKVLLNDLRVHRSSAVCAILARLPGVAQVSGPGITLRWTG